VGELRDVVGGMKGWESEGMIPGDEGWKSLGPIHGRRRGDIAQKLIQKDEEVGEPRADTGR
jgi:hypothetical protein